SAIAIPSVQLPQCRWNHTAPAIANDAKHSHTLRSALFARVSKDEAPDIDIGASWFETPRKSAAPHHEGEEPLRGNSLDCFGARAPRNDVRRSLTIRLPPPRGWRGRFRRR